jgi:hypothetical protein
VTATVALAGTALAAALVFPPAVRAAEVDRFDGRSLWLEAQGGWAMPLGFYGLALDLSLSREVAVSAGLGYTHEAGYGIAKQGMVAGRYRYPFGAGWAAAAGGGVSSGTYDQITFGSLGRTVQRWRPAVRLNAELSLEYRPVAQLNLRAFAGLGYIANDPTHEPVSQPGYDRTPAFFGVALAYQLVGDSVAREAGEADDPTDDDEAAAPGTLLDRWYGWQTLTADVVALSLGLAALHEHATDWAYASKGASIAIYFAGAPAVHLAQRKPLRGVLSLTARVFIPLLGAVIYPGIVPNSYECSGIDCSLVQGLIGGAVAASIFDAAVLAYQ